MFVTQNSIQQIRPQANALNLRDIKKRGLALTGTQEQVSAGSPTPGRPVFAKSAGSSSISRELYDPYNGPQRNKTGGFSGRVLTPKQAEHAKFLAEHREARQNAMRGLTDRGFTRPVRESRFGKVSSFQYPADVWKGPDGRLVHLNGDGTLSPWNGRRY